MTSSSSSSTLRPGGLYDLTGVARATREFRNMHQARPLQPYDLSSVAEHSRHLAPFARPLPSSPSLYDLGAARPATRR